MLNARKKNPANAITASGGGGVRYGDFSPRPRTDAAQRAVPCHFKLLRVSRRIFLSRREETRQIIRQCEQIFSDVDKTRVFCALYIYIIFFYYKLHVTLYFNSILRNVILTELYTRVRMCVCVSR